MSEFLRPEDPHELHSLSASVEKFSTSSFAFDPELPFNYSRELLVRFAELGILGISVPEQKGGLGLNSLYKSICLFEIARVDLAPAILCSVHMMVAEQIAKWDEEAQHEGLLSDLVSGDKLAAFALTEAGAGSDAAALKTSAAPQGDSYLLNGEKIYISNADNADVFLLFARMKDPALGDKNITAFVVEKSISGLSVGPPEKKMGCEGSSIASVSFSDALLPASALLSTPGNGLSVALATLSPGRIGIAAAACGLAAKAIALAGAHMRTRKQFGQSIQHFQGLRFMLADMLIALNSSVATVRDACKRLEVCQAKGERLPNSVASSAKCLATDASMKICSDAVQLLGGAGYLREYEVEKLMRDAKMLQFVEGTNQIQREIIAKDYFRS